jgi:hypothetical protein
MEPIPLSIPIGRLLKRFALLYLLMVAMIKFVILILMAKRISALISTLVSPVLSRAKIFKIRWIAIILPTPSNLIAIVYLSRRLI